VGTYDVLRGGDVDVLETVVLESILPVLWGLTISGYWIVLWPLAYANHWALGEYSD
jgi:hypothetical protein